VAIAAMKAGADSVLAADIDPWTETAIKLNSRLNDVALAFTGENQIGRSIEADVLLAGDVFYDKSFADSLIPWFTALVASGKTVIVGDPGRSYCPKERMVALATYPVPVTRALEDAEVKKTTVWRFVGIAA
jgi:predicted nicotinamide N-methyase